VVSTGNPKNFCAGMIRKPAAHILLCAIACGFGTNVMIGSQRDFRALRVFFAHQSVGENILGGVRMLAPDVRIVRGETPPASPAILETLIGRNEEPESKLDHFTRAMKALGNHVDVAMVKFCYIDFSVQTDVNALRQRYQQTMSTLASAYPRTVFAHVTVPLTTTQTGPVAAVKRLLGRPVWGEEENRIRSEFNQWLRGTYPKQLIFDLADLEARTPTGSLVTFELRGAAYPRLFEGYTDDGQHLSVDGRRVVAKGLLGFLNDLANDLAH